KQSLSKKEKIFLEGLLHEQDNDSNIRTNTKKLLLETLECRTTDYGTEEIQNKLIQESLSKEITKKSIINLQQSNIITPMEETKDIQETKAKIRTPKIVVSTSYSQPRIIEKKEIKSKQAKLNSTRILDQSNTILIDSTTKKHKDKKNQKIAATQENKLAEI
ncbi:1845_t:CDS:2, partial [Gigaspora margarita]